MEELLEASVLVRSRSVGGTLVRKTLVSEDWITKE
jgi:hypothetical protein